MSGTPSGHAYGIGIITVIVGLSAGLVFYQYFYIPESLAKPQVAEEILEPHETITIQIIEGSADPNQQDNFVPKLVNLQLGIDNHVVWENVDNTPHTVTPDHKYEDEYSGMFGSDGVVMPGESYEFLFTQPAEIPYHCEPHPWMKGTLEITKARF